MITYPDINTMKPDAYGPPCVMKSAAGYYVGTYYRNDELGQPFLEPGSRDSHYFATEAEAAAYLATFEA